MRNEPARGVLLFVRAASIVLLTACGGGGGGSGGGGTAAATTYMVGGMVSGLMGSGLVLRDNGGDDLAVSISGSFTFATKLANGAAYSATVKTQPISPTQSCVVSSGSGTVGTGRSAG